MVSKESEDLAPAWHHGTKRAILLGFSILSSGLEKVELDGS